MSKTIKNFISMFLAMVLIFTALPVAAFAQTDAPALPTVSVTNLDEENLNYAANFQLDTPSDDQSNYYGYWNAEIEVSFNKAVTLNGANTDIILSARSASLGITEWTPVPTSEISLAAGEVFPVMSYASQLLGSETQPNFYDLRDAFNNIDLGLSMNSDFLAQNPDTMATINVRIYNDTESIILASAEFGTPELPTAKITALDAGNMTFAMNFQAQQPTNSQAKFYGEWFADFVLTINKDVIFDANGTGDGYLAGQYDAWSPNWVYVPLEPVSLKANEPLNIMQFAAKMLNKPGLRYTYTEIIETVKDFDCGIYFTPEFLAANPDLELKLELKMYNPVNPDESYTIGDAYTLGIPQLPTATATEFAKDDLTFAMNFKADEATSSQVNYYGNWFADFEITFNKDVTLDANGTGDGHLAGQYDGQWKDLWNGEWVNVPFNKVVSVKANEPVRIMALAADLLNEPGLKYTYREVYEVVQDFKCGAYFTPEFLAANPDLKVTLELKMYNPENEAESYVIGQTYEFENTFVAINKETGKTYSDLQIALDDASADQTVMMVRDVKARFLFVNSDSTLDLNGNVLTCDYTSVFGAIADNSADNSGRLVTPTKGFLVSPNNPQLPILTDTGYAFVEIVKFNTLVRGGGKEYVFQPLFETAADAMVLNRVKESGVSILVEVSWRNEGENGSHTQIFEYDESFVNTVLSNRRPDGQYAKVFNLIINSDTVVDLTFTAKVISSGVVISA